MRINADVNLAHLTSKGSEHPKRITRLGYEEVILINSTSSQFKAALVACNRLIL